MTPVFLLYMSLAVHYYISCSRYSHRDFVHQHAIGKAHQRERKEQIKEKRKNAQKSNIRDSISGEEFYHIIHSIKNNHFVSSRKKEL